MPARQAGILGELHLPLGLGLLRLATEGRPEEADAIEVIRFALDQGIRVFDTADSYCLDDKDLHYGERLAREAATKSGALILTKVGMMRPKGKWLPNGKPDHIKRAVERSLAALGVEQIFLLQLHAVDPKVPLEKSLIALAELQREGKVAHLGLCNVGAGEIKQASEHFKVAAVQNELSVLTRKSASDGLLELTRDLGIPFLAHRPLGGHAKVEKLDKNKILKPLAERHGVTPREIALAALLDAAPHVIPLIGATRIESVKSSLAALKIKLDVSDRTALEMRHSFAASPEAVEANRRLFAMGRPLTPSPSPPEGRGEQGGSPVAARPSPLATPDVLIVMGIQGAGKSELVTDFVNAGYARLNRDLAGGKLDDLVPRMLQLFAAGQKRVILDNTYPTRVSRAPVVAAAYSQGIPVRCVHLQIPLAEAQANIVLRNLAKYGRLLGPDEMKVLVKSDPTLPPPAALLKWLSSFEAPSLSEGFASLDVIPFVRRIDPAHTEKGLFLDVDGTIRRTKSGAIYPTHADDVELLPGRREVLTRWIEQGYKLFFVSNQSGIASGKLDHAAAQSAFVRTVELLGLPVTEVVYCPHPAFPVGCYCRKPHPGLGVYLMQRHRLARDHLIMVGDMKSDAEFASAVGARYFEGAQFFADV
jgi:HAD superfamily hydrolase (TIGR01662 family)